MTGWEAFWIGYFFVGIGLTVLASIGHQTRFNESMHWGMKVAGPFFWPFLLLIGGRK